MEGRGDPRPARQMIQTNQNRELSSWGITVEHTFARLRSYAGLSVVRPFDRANPRQKLSVTSGLANLQLGWNSIKRRRGPICELIEERREQCHRKARCAR